MTAEFIKFLTEDCLYKDARIIGDRYFAIYPLLFTHAIITGRVGDRFSYEDRWCYHTYAAAKIALDAWNGEGEPEGWHRHPDTGRRRDENGREYINP
jgi:hypothetical protein